MLFFPGSRGPHGLDVHIATWKHSAMNYAIATWKHSAMNYAHVLCDSDDKTVTVSLQRYVTIEEASYKMLPEMYHKSTDISEAFEDSLRNLSRHDHPINESYESQKSSDDATV